MNHSFFFTKVVQPVDIWSHKEPFFTALTCVTLNAVFRSGRVT